MECSQLISRHEDVSNRIDRSATQQSLQCSIRRLEGQIPKAFSAAFRTPHFPPFPVRTIRGVQQLDRKRNAMLRFSRTTMKTGSIAAITKPLCSIIISSCPQYLYPFLRGSYETITTNTNVNTSTSNIRKKSENDIESSLTSASGVVQESEHESKNVYVHPLSQIVLEHLQTSHSDWVSKVGLDTKGGFTLKKDGTFVLYFPPVPSAHTHPSTHNPSNATVHQGKIW
jgi:hypothetical protein